VHADELADETLDRVARKLDEGTIIPPGSLGGYVRGVARLVFYESRREMAKEEPLPATEFAAPAPAEESRALECLDQCLATLSHDERSLVLRYYDGNRIEQRRTIADTLGISMTAVRIRTHRLRERLERCVASCASHEAKRLPPSRHPHTER
jgi:DNA-directed RNA polymerase specialized sigma24 family protein